MRPSSENSTVSFNTTSPGPSAASQSTSTLLAANDRIMVEQRRPIDYSIYDEQQEPPPSTRIVPTPPSASANDQEPPSEIGEVSSGENSDSEAPPSTQQDNEMSHLRSVVLALRLNNDIQQRSLEQSAHVAKKAVKLVNIQLAANDVLAPQLEAIENNSRLTLESASKQQIPMLLEIQDNLEYLEMTFNQMYNTVGDIHSRLFNTTRREYSFQVSAYIRWSPDDKMIGGRMLVQVESEDPHREEHALYEGLGRFLSLTNHAASSDVDYRHHVQDMYNDIDAWLREPPSADNARQEACHPMTRRQTEDLLNCGCINSLTAFEDTHESLRVCVTRRLAQEALLEIKHQMMFRPLRKMTSVKLDWIS